MEKLTFRKLRCDEIEVRIGSTTKKTFSLLLYKDARVDMALLDEVVGPHRWQRKHYMLGSDIYCSVGIYYDDIGWVWKDDAGSSGTIEVEKSKASDSFKRACVNATGVGRELYTAPEIKIWKKDENDESYKYNHYFVKEIAYENNQISKLVICEEDNGTVVFSYPKYQKVSQTAQNQQKNEGLNPNQIKTDIKGSIRQEEKDLIQKYLETLDGDKSTKFFKWLEEKFNTMNVSMLSAEQGVVVVNALKLRK